MELVCKREKMKREQVFLNRDILESTFVEIDRKVASIYLIKQQNKKKPWLPNIIFANSDLYFYFFLLLETNAEPKANRKEKPSAQKTRRACFETSRSIVIRFHQELIDHGLNFFFCCCCYCRCRGELFCRSVEPVDQDGLAASENNCKSVSGRQSRLSAGAKKLLATARGKNFS